MASVGSSGPCSPSWREYTIDSRGARGSNAGDQFHELWALEQVLGLLDPKAGLMAVTVEGIPPGGQGSAADKPLWDGVDCALFYGGATLEHAKRVDLVQLKYSTDPARPWALSRLVTNTARNGNNSVLRRLAQAFAAAARKAPNAQLSLRFVSNQPIAQSAIDVLKAGSIGENLPEDLLQDVQKVRHATGLNGDQLSRLLDALDVSGCGVESRFAHRERVVLAVAKLLESNAAADVAELRVRVRELMLPERAGEVVTAKTVLSWFGIADPAGLFPCPQSVVQVQHPVSRQASEQVAKLLKGGSRIVCLDGPAGCGKTTAMSQLRAFLPDASCFILFDCYGGGRYLCSNDQRHRPENAFLQIANDAALSLRTPFLIARTGRDPVNLRQFLRRLTDLGQLVNDAKPGALFVVAIDAADNAVSAAARGTPSEACFVRELCSADLSTLPPNVCFVLSSRTARLGDIGFPPHTYSVQQH